MESPKFDSPLFPQPTVDPMEAKEKQEIKRRPDFALCEISGQIAFDIHEQRIVPKAGRMNPKACLKPCQYFVLSQHLFPPPSFTLIHYFSECEI